MLATGAAAMQPDDHEAQALEFLRTKLGADAPAHIHFAARFEEEPLEREGPMSVFSFTTGVGGTEPQPYWVVAGRTDPNYYPNWGLTAEEIYSVHLGTRFMLVVGVSRIEPADVPLEGVAQKLHAFIATFAPGEPVEFLTPAGDAAAHPVPAVCFRVDHDLHAVFRMRIGLEEVYVLGLDCPAGIYRQVWLLPHVVYRLHIGTLIRRERPPE
ncbi:MAG TPA: hypothetical protein VGM03_09175 [Phycisphaerae bacterium]